jgi:hypothetical protein
MRHTAAIVLMSVALLATAAPAAAADKAQTASGTIRRVQASARTLVVALADGGEASFTWDDDTKISGVLSPGSKVTLRYATRADGGKLAIQITVARS